MNVLDKLNQLKDNSMNLLLDVVVIYSFFLKSKSKFVNQTLQIPTLMVI